MNLHRKWAVLLLVLVSGSAHAETVLVVQVLAGEGEYSISQRLEIDGTSQTGDFTFPIMLVRDGEGLIGLPENTKVIGSGGAIAKIDGDTVTISGKPDGSGPFAVQTRYVLPATKPTVNLRMNATIPLDFIKIVHRFNEFYGPQVRPLAPYKAEVFEESGYRWVYANLDGPMADGDVLDVVVGHLPAPLYYLQYASIVLGLVVVGLGVMTLLRRRRG